MKEKKTKKSWSKKEDAFIISLLKKNGNKSMTQDNYRQLSKTILSHFGVYRSISSLTARFSKLKDEMLKAYNESSVDMDCVSIKQYFEETDVKQAVQCLAEIKTIMSIRVEDTLKELHSEINRLTNLVS